jgi:hypothetical protein
MNASPALSAAVAPPPIHPAAPQPSSRAGQDDAELRQAFDSFVGEVFFGQLLKAMRKTLDKPAYFYGGRAEDLFTQQLDQVLAEKLGNASAEKFTGPMFELFSLSRT